MNHKKNKKDRINKELAKALQYHQSGKLAQAEQLYKKILKKDYNNSEATHLLGFLAHQCGKNNIAIQMIQKAISINPNNPIYYNNLATVFHSMGDFEKALSCYKQAISLKPDYAIAYNNMANLLKEHQKFNEALFYYEKALKIDPNYIDASYNYGLCLFGIGDFIKAIEYFQKTIDLKQDHMQAYYNMGLAFEKIDKKDKAANCYEIALKLAPDYGPIYYSIGILFHKMDQLDDAINFYSKAIELQPDYVDAYYNLGLVYKQLGQIDYAIKNYNKVLELNPKYPQAYYNLGIILSELNKLQDAIFCYQKTIELNPLNANAYNNLGTLYKKEHEIDKAFYCYEQAIKIDSNYANAYTNLANLFQDIGEIDKAFIYHKKAFDIEPNNPKICNNIGNILKEYERFEDALDVYQKAIDIDPNNPEILNNMGVILKELGKTQEAIDVYKKAFGLNPDYAKACASIAHQLQYICAWDELEFYSEKLNSFIHKAIEYGQEIPEEPFMNIARIDDPKHNFAVSRFWADKIHNQVKYLNPKFVFNDRKDQKITIGYLSNNFNNHPMAHLMLGLFEFHDRDKFNVFCYSCGRDDQSFYSTKIKQDCDKFVDLTGLGHYNSAKLIYEDKVDILVDLMGYTKGARLAISALRPAPIQARYLGMPGTTGADFFDYLITDQIVTPKEHSQYYSENFVYLPYTYQINNNKQKISEKKFLKKECGLPEDKFIFCSFNTVYKIDSVIFDIWMQILDSVPDSVLWLLKSDDLAQKNIKQFAKEKNIDPNRIVFAPKLPKDQHLSRIKLAELALDTRIVNGAATTSDALWAGVPVLTCQGRHFASRMSTSILSAIGLNELITYSLKEYKDKAIFLAKNGCKLNEIEQKLLQNRLTFPLFDTLRFIKNLEKAYEKMWMSFRQGEKQKQFTIVDDEL